MKFTLLFNSGSNRLKGWSKILHHTVKSNTEKHWFLIKVATFWNNKKKILVFTQSQTSSMHGNILKDRFRNSATFKMELFATFGNGRAYNQWTVVFACWCSNLTMFKGKIEIVWKWSCLEGGIRYAFFSCRHDFIIFWKRQLLSVSPTCYFILNINYKNENWYHCQFCLPGFYYQKQLLTYVLKNVVIKRQEKQLWRSSFL